MLSEAFPALANSKPGAIQEPALPSLRHLVVVDDMSDLKDFQKELRDIRPAVDFREVLVWREHGAEEKVVEETKADLHYKDVMNLQFTRYAVVSAIVYASPNDGLTLISSGTTGDPKAVSVMLSPPVVQATSVDCFKSHS